MTDCKSYEQNLAKCNCTYEPCSRKGYCCECIEYHLKLGEAPACMFPDDAEKTFNRSFKYLAEIINSR